MSNNKTQKPKNNIETVEPSKLPREDVEDVIAAMSKARKPLTIIDIAKEINRMRMWRACGDEDEKRDVLSCEYSEIEQVIPDDLKITPSDVNRVCYSLWEFPENSFRVKLHRTRDVGKAAQWAIEKTHNNKKEIVEHEKPKEELPPISITPAQLIDNCTDEQLYAKLQKMGIFVFVDMKSFPQFDKLASPHIIGFASPSTECTQHSKLLRTTGENTVVFMAMYIQSLTMYNNIQQKYIIASTNPEYREIINFIMIVNRKSAYYVSSLDEFYKLIRTF